MSSRFYVKNALVRHTFKPSHKVLIDAFWYIVNIVVDTTEEYQLTFYTNIILNAQKSKVYNLEQIKSAVDIIADYSLNHIKVLKLSDGIMEYYELMEMLTNSIPDTILKCIQFSSAELIRQPEKCSEIWKDLLELGLRKESGVHRRMTEKMFARMSLTSDSGKAFLRFISKCG